MRVAGSRPLDLSLCDRHACGRRQVIVLLSRRPAANAAKRLREAAADVRNGFGLPGGPRPPPHLLRIAADCVRSAPYVLHSEGGNAV